MCSSGSGVRILRPLLIVCTLLHHKMLAGAGSDCTDASYSEVLRTPKQIEALLGCTSIGQLNIEFMTKNVPLLCVIRRPACPECC